jgi:PAS domain S-box-containing protein
LPWELEDAHSRAELLRREAALKASEARLRLAQQAARVGTWEWDLRTGASVWSEMIWRLLGLEPGDGPTTVERFLEFIHPEDRDRAWQKVNEVISTGEEYYDEFRIIRRDRQVLWVSSKGRLIRSADGQPERMLGVNIDITERRKTEDALRESEERLRLAQQAARVGTWEWDLETGASIWSDMIWDLLGLQPSEGPATLERFMEFVHPDDRAAVLRKANDVIAYRNDYYDEFRLVRRDGQVSWAAAKGRAIGSADSPHKRMIGVTIDITERKRLWPRSRS